MDAEFLQRYEPLSILPDVDDFDALRAEFVNIYLQRSRAMTRMNRGWDRKTSTGSLEPKAYEEFEIVDLYLDRLARREQRLTAVLDDGIERIRERAYRLRPHLRAIELLAAGKMAALQSTAASGKTHDDFVDCDPSELELWPAPPEEPVRREDHSRCNAD